MLRRVWLRPVLGPSPLFAVAVRYGPISIAPSPPPIRIDQAVMPTPRGRRPPPLRGGGVPVYRAMCVRKTMTEQGLASADEAVSSVRIASASSSFHRSVHCGSPSGTVEPVPAPVGPRSWPSDGRLAGRRTKMHRSVVSGGGSERLLALPVGGVAMFLGSSASSNQPPTPPRPQGLRPLPPRQAAAKRAATAATARGGPPEPAGGSAGPREAGCECWRLVCGRLGAPNHPQRRSQASGSQPEPPGSQPQRSQASGSQPEPARRPEGGAQTCIRAGCEGGWLDGSVSWGTPQSQDRSVWPSAWRAPLQNLDSEVQASPPIHAATAAARESPAVAPRSPGLRGSAFGALL